MAPLWSPFQLSASAVRQRGPKVTEAVELAKPDHSGSSGPEAWSRAMLSVMSWARCVVTGIGLQAGVERLCDVEGAAAYNTRHRAEPAAKSNESRVPVITCIFPHRCLYPPNGSRLSCGRPTRRRKGVGRQSVPARAQHSVSFRAIIARQLQALVRQRLSSAHPPESHRRVAATASPCPSE